MGRSILKKLKSNEGASITFALLAFLVCAVISAVLLASALASAGRLSNLAESDQRYYAVTSAAQLFCDELDRQMFTIEREQTSYTTLRQVFTYIDGAATKTYEATDLADDKDGLDTTWKNVILFPEGSGTVDISAAADLESVMKNSFLAEAAIKHILAGRTVDEGTWLLKRGEGEYQWEMLMNAVSGSISIQIDVSAKMAKNGDIKLTFTNHEAAGKNDLFSVGVTLSANITDTNSPATVTESQTNYSFTDSGYTMVRTDTLEETKTTTIFWTVGDIKKVSA